MRTIARRALGGLALAAGALVLGACSSTADKTRPADLGADPARLKVRTAWTARVGDSSTALSLQVQGDTVIAASSDGTVLALESATGRERWRASVGEGVAAGVGSDGTTSAVITRGNELVALRDAREAWRRKLTAQAYTAPFVAGGRVFVLAADRSVTAYDAGNGARIWTLNRPGEPLVLRQPGVLLAVGDTLVAGLSGRLVGINPGSGGVRWEAPVATPRGVNEVERLVDLVERTSRVGDSVCARAFQSAVGCVNAARGTLAWTKPANGATGVQGDARLVVGAEADGKVVAWRRDTGERAWSQDQLLHRGLASPLMLGRAVAVADASGFVHFLSAEDGSLLTRAATDGSAVSAPPVLAGSTVVVATRAGNLFGIAPE